MVERSTRFDIPPLHQRKCIPMDVIQAVANEIAGRFDPERIVLFGSHAYGTPQPWSDVDLLVILDTQENPIDASQAILHSLPPFLFSVDIIVRSPEALKNRIDMGDPFLKEVTRKGKVLYERVDQ